MLLIIDCRLGQDKIEGKNSDHVFAILEHRFSIGVITGIGGGSDICCWVSGEAFDCAGSALCAIGESGGEELF
jgi:hypothetical protein